MFEITKPSVQEFKLSFAKLLLSTSQLRYITLEPGNIIPPPTTSKDYVALQQALLTQDRQLDAIQGDGNCLFRSISKELLGHERHHPSLRNILVNFIEHNPSSFSCLMRLWRITASVCTSGAPGGRKWNSKHCLASCR